MPLVNFIILPVNDVIGETGSNLRERNEGNKDKKERMRERI